MLFKTHMPCFASSDVFQVNVVCVCEMGIHTIRHAGSKCAEKGKRRDWLKSFSLMTMNEISWCVGGWVVGGILECMFEQVCLCTHACASVSAEEEEWSNWSVWVCGYRLESLIKTTLSLTLSLFLPERYRCVSPCIHLSVYPFYLSFCPPMQENSTTKINLYNPGLQV